MNAYEFLYAFKQLLPTMINVITFGKPVFYLPPFSCAGSLLWCGLFSHWGARSLGHAGFSRLDSWALEHGLRACGPWA